MFLILFGMRQGDSRERPYIGRTLHVANFGHHEVFGRTRKRQSQPMKQNQLGCSPPDVILELAKVVVIAW